jgi:NitT/TauT family transport system substrate-binding protein
VTKAVKYVNETDSTHIAPYLTAYFEGISETALAASIERYRDIDSWNTQLTISEEGFNRLQDIIENAGELSRRASLNELANNTFAQNVYKEVYNIT